MLLALAVASFALGFFVLARLPRFNPADTSATRETAPATTEASRAAPAEGRAAPAQETETPLQPPVPAAPPGPTIDPEEPQGLQPPETPDSSRTEPTQESRPVPPPSPGSVAGAEREAATQVTDPVQSPGTPDTGQGGVGRTLAADNPPDAPADNAPSTLYRVQVGVYSTREAAERESRALAARGIETVVQATSINGKTLYRLQYGAYRHRANAEAARERLEAAGIASVVQGPDVAQPRP